MSDNNSKNGNTNDKDKEREERQKDRESNRTIANWAFITFLAGSVLVGPVPLYLDDDQSKSSTITEIFEANSERQDRNSIIIQDELADLKLQIARIQTDSENIAITYSFDADYGNFVFENFPDYDDDHEDGDCMLGVGDDDDLLKDINTYFNQRHLITKPKTRNTKHLLTLRIENRIDLLWPTIEDGDSPREYHHVTQISDMIKANETIKKDNEKSKLIDNLWDKFCIGG